MSACGWDNWTNFSAFVRAFSFYNESFFLQISKLLGLPLFSHNALVFILDFTLFGLNNKGHKVKIYLPITKLLGYFYCSSKHFGCENSSSSLKFLKGVLRTCQTSMMELFPNSRKLFSEKTPSQMLGEF